MVKRKKRLRHPTNLARVALSLQKRTEFFVGMHNKPLSVVAVRICNKDCLSVGINH
jgi:hypothetical protein